ncbi:MAG: acylphosphatase [Gammaproteobacteria bacterium RIFCSPHIGHO2_12_FULL_38_14]|nr:MAG: acylphosphatase [Gammaproteobacteria bacterium RIFCSPHIGHO2_12_FULL_38_14]
MTDQICIHCIISGKVQGVWFRASTKAQADALGLTGWVRNLSDGRVEVMACGDPKLVDALKAWFKIGPRLARVDECISNDVPVQTFIGFQVL